MQHTLIPFKDRKRLHREYVIRVVAVFIFGLSLSVMVGAVALFPGYIRAWFYHNAAQSAVAGTQLSKTDEGLDVARNTLANDSKLLAALVANTEDSAYTDVVKSIVGIRGNVVITHFNINHADAKSVSIGIKGRAPTRNDLIAFKGRLEALVPGSRIDIPIDQLAKNTNPPFSLNFVKKQP